MALPKTVTKAELARLFNKDVRSVTNYQNEGMPVLRENGRPAYDPIACVAWYVEHERDIARAGKGLNELDQMRARKTLAEAQKAEIELAQLESRMILTEAAEAINGELCDRLSAVLVNIPANHGHRLEELGIPADKAEAVLEAITGELTNSLRGVADDLEAVKEDDDGDGDRASDTAA